MLERPGVLTVICELEPASMTQHVRMDRERHLGGLAESTHHASKPNRTHGCPPLTHEHVAPCVSLPLQPTQRPKFAARQRVHGRHAILDAGDVEAAMSQVYLVPA